MQALVWLYMVWFTEIWFAVVQFSDSCTNIRRPHIFVLQIWGQNLILHSSKLGIIFVIDVVHLESFSVQDICWSYLLLLVWVPVMVRTNVLEQRVSLFFWMYCMGVVARETSNMFTYQYPELSLLWIVCYIENLWYNLLLVFYAFWYWLPFFSPCPWRMG